MPKHNMQFEWEVLPENLAEWHLLATLDAHSDGKPAPHMSWLPSRILLSIAAIVLLVLGAGAYVLWHTAQLGLDQIHGDLQAAIDDDSLKGQNWLESQRESIGSDLWWITRQAQAPAARSNSDQAPPHVTMDNVSLREGLAMVEVTVDGPGILPYRETRFYQEVRHGEWLRTSAANRFWGNKHNLETTFFTISYFDRDASAVKATAAELDTLYANMHRDMGLPSPLGKLAVDVAPIPLSQFHYQRFTEGRLVVPSPAMLQIPLYLTDEVILTQSIINPLVVEVTQQTASRPAWRMLMFGVQSWQAHAVMPPPSFSLWDMAAWLDVGAPKIHPNRIAASAQELDRVCQGYQIWRYSLPVILYPPTLCSTLEEAHTDHPLAPTVPLPAKLSIISEDWGRQSYWTDVPHEQTELYGNFMREVAAATLIDYMIQVYGREKLPDMMAAMRVYDTWDRLIPAILGISAHEFESGWQDYLRTQNELHQQRMR